MFIKNQDDCEQFTAGHSTILRELLHPAKAALKFICTVVPAWRREDEAAMSL